MENFLLSKQQSQEIAKVLAGDVKSYVLDNFERYFPWLLNEIRKSKGKAPIICGTSSKPKSQKQILAWLKNPYSDAAEYKMWGNGIALPCVYFLLSGIVWSARNESIKTSG